MDSWTVVVFLAVAATIVSLISGITAMVRDGPVAHNDSAHWMVWRVVFQAAALILVMAAVISAR